MPSAREALSSIKEVAKAGWSWPYYLGKVMTLAYLDREDRPVQEEVRTLCAQLGFDFNSWWSCLARG